MIPNISLSCVLKDDFNIHRFVIYNFDTCSDKQHSLIIQYQAPTSIAVQCSVTFTRVCTRYRVCNALKDSNGEKLFKLERKKLIKLFGSDEGQRLYSQITVQKKQNGVSIMISRLIAARNVHCLFIRD